MGLLGLCKVLVRAGAILPRDNTVHTLAENNFGARTSGICIAARSIAAYSITCVVSGATN
jgi:hypothetical protein